MSSYATASSGVAVWSEGGSKRAAAAGTGGETQAELASMATMPMGRGSFLGNLSRGFPSRSFLRLPPRGLHRVAMAASCSSASHSNSIRAYDDRDAGDKSRDSGREAKHRPKEGESGTHMTTEDGAAEKTREAAREGAEGPAETVKETKGSAKESAEMAKEKAAEAAEKAKETKEAAKGKAAGAAGSAAEKTREASHRATEAAREAKEKAKEHAEAATEKAAGTAGAAAEKTKEGASRVTEAAHNLGEKAKQKVQDAWGAVKETVQKIKEEEVAAGNDGEGEGGRGEGRKHAHDKED